MILRRRLVKGIYITYAFINLYVCMDVCMYKKAAIILNSNKQINK